MNEDANFSTFNFEYFLKVRELAIKDSQIVSTYLGVDSSFSQLITAIDTSALVELGRIKQPLVVPFQPQWWWERLFTALKSGRTEEINLILEQASIITARPGGPQ